MDRIKNKSIRLARAGEDVENGLWVVKDCVKWNVSWDELTQYIKDNYTGDDIWNDGEPHG